MHRRLSILLLILTGFLFTQPIMAQASFGAQQVITDSADGAYSVHAADLDGDGDYDVLSASWDDDKIAWYENDGSGNFGAQQVITTSADGANPFTPPTSTGTGISTSSRRLGRTIKSRGMKTTEAETSAPNK